jgi:thiamine-phosphate pyrophosphorylase
MQGICLVTDRELCGGRPLEWVVARALEGGVASVQLREKELSTRAFLEEALTLKALLDAAGLPLIINDRVDVALAAGAAGVHLGQADLPCEAARRLLGPRAILGLSVECWEDVVRAEDQPVDYLGVSPVFATPTKTDTREPWGLEGLVRIRAFSRHPLVAIGGVHPGNAAALRAAGASGLAVVSALCAVPDPAGAARELVQAFRNSQ